MVKAEALSASLEDYLEAIFHIVARNQVARAKDISLRMKVSGPSVTGALRSLSEKGLINYAPYDVITLTDKGNALAEDVVRRHLGEGSDVTRVGQDTDHLAALQVVDSLVSTLRTPPAIGRPPAGSAVPAATGAGRRRPRPTCGAPAAPTRG